MTRLLLITTLWVVGNFLNATWIKVEKEVVHKTDSLNPYRYERESVLVQSCLIFVSHILRFIIYSFA